MSVPLQVALIGAVAALIGTSISFLSNLLTHWYSRRSKIDDWLFEKRVFEIQAAITRIDDSTSELAECFDLAWDTYRPLIVFCDFHVAGIKETQNAENLEDYKKRAGKIFTETLDEASTSSRKSVDKIAFFVRDTLDWANFETPRLRSWLTNPEVISPLLKELFYEQVRIESELIQILNSIIFRYGDRVFCPEEAFDSEDKEFVREIQTRLNTASNRRYSLVNERARLQKLLASDLSATVKPFWRYVRELFFPGSD